jgi:RNA polymerase sigma-70 factor (ECF subfamily)
MDRPRPDPEALLAHEAFLRRIARPLVRDEGLVDDVVQDTWLAALKKQPRDASRLRQWLGTVAKNLALRSRRAEERRVRREQAAARPEDDDVVARVARHQKIVDAVLSLDEPYRTAVLLRFYDGLSSDQIGARSGVSGAAVRKRLAKALELLRVRLDEFHGGDRRAWGAVLLPFVVAPRMKPAALVGGIVMGTKAKLGLAAVLLLALLGTLWTVTRPPDAAARSEPVAGRPAPATDAPTVPPDPLPSPVDFAFVDRDRDVHGVVVQRDGAPVPGATLEAVRFPWRRVLHASHDRRFEEQAGPRTRSASDGTFALRLEWGDLVQVRASATGFATIDVPLVQAGERVRIVLAPPFRLAVRVNGSAGSPVAGARLELVLRDDVDRGVGRVLTADRCRRDAVTGEDGRVVWEDLPDGDRAYLYAEHRMYVSANRRINLGAERDVEITMGTGLTVRGRVLDATTLRPIAGALVDTLGHGPKETRTDAVGRYGLVGLDPTVLHACADGYAQAAVQIHRDGLYRQLWPQRVVEHAEEVDIHLLRADVVTGRIVDVEGAPVAGAFLAVRSPAAFSVSTESGPDGRFRLEGPWSVRAPSGPATGDTAETPIGDGWQHLILVFARGHGRTQVAFDARKLDLGDVVLPPAGAIEGRVLTPDDEPVPGAAVLLQRGMMTESRRTDDLGRFRFPDLEPGAYNLSTQPDGAPILCRDVELPPGQRVVADLRFESWRPFTIRVRTEEGAPVAGATVGVSTGFRMSQATTGEDGSAVVTITGIPRYASVEVPGLTGELRFRQPPLIELDGDEREEVFVLVKEGLVRGRVEGPEGAPVTMARLEVRQADRTVGHGGTGEDDTFEVRVPREGTFDLVLAGRLDPGSPHESRILRGELKDMRAGATGLVLRARAVEATRTVRVRVLAPDGSPAEASVLASPSARPFYVVTSGGIAELAGLPDEEVQVQVSGAWEWSWLDPKPLRVIPAGQEVTLRFRKAGTIVGRVLLPDGSPAAQASVAALRGKDELATCYAAADGSFGLALEPGTEGPLRLRALHDHLAGLQHAAVLDRIEPGASGVEIRLAAVR